MTTYINMQGKDPILVEKVEFLPYVTKGTYRDTVRIVLKGQREDIFNTFVDGIEFSISYEGGIVPNVEGINYKAFCVAGDITDHRDGRFTVYMGKKTREEILEEENAALLFKLLTGEDFE